MRLRSWLAERFPKKSLGRRGEDAATRFLKRLGYRIALDDMGVPTYSFYAGGTASRDFSAAGRAILEQDPHARVACESLLTTGLVVLAGEITTTGAELLDFGTESVGLPGGGILEFFAGRTEAGSQEIPISIDMEMESEDGRIKVTEGGGEIAGVPTGPLAELITAAIVLRI